MENITARVGSKINIRIEQGDENSISATIVVRNIETEETEEFTGTFTDGVTDIEIDGLDIGEYEYDVEENFETGDPLIYPDPDDCDGEECDLPTITICRSARTNGTS